MNRKMMRGYTGLFLAAAGLCMTSATMGQSTVGLNVAGEVRFPDLNSAPPQMAPVCFNAASGFIGACAQVNNVHGVAWVATAGGDYGSPVQALNEVGNWCGAPSEGNRCLIRIAPGSYDLGDQQLVMRPFVDIRGSGWNMTILQGARSAASVSDAALVKGAPNSVLAQLTLFNSGSAGTGQAYTTGYAAENISGSSDVAPDLDHVTIKAAGNAANTYGVYLQNVSDSRLERVWLDVDGDNHCVALMAENSESGGAANRLHAHTANHCDSAIGVYLNSVEMNILNSTIDVTANGSGTSYGVVFQESGSGERFSMVRDSEIVSEVVGGSGNAIGVEFRGNGSGGIINAVIGGEAATGAGHGVHFVSTAENARVVNSALIGSTASVNDEAAQTNCKGNLDADLNDVGC